ncbi:isochorismate synthase [Streptomyces sp. OF3]|uniref:isochorismate synthase n=1 Tax=Streptomyces alkaliterrae TaxID=2213162 RepID=A0A7W3WKZ8_9ACTN|nr:isochorismate synthase [Streptomyces alkaliterrae]MBB1254313.1 isochorismate synthase [Streptomyces alkaliterrae]
MARAPLGAEHAGSPAQWLLSTPRATLVARGGDRLSAPIGPGQFAALAGAAESALRAGPAGAVVVGAIPFDETTTRAHLLLTRVERRAHQPGRRPHAVAMALQEADRPPWPPAATAGPPLPRVEDPPPAAYLSAVRDALAEIRGGTVTKVVLARTLHVSLPEGRPYRELASALVSSLARREPTAHLFSVTVSRPHPDAAGAVLVGATPETLLRRSGDLLTVTPLAGSIARDPDPAVDRARATSLLRSAKDRDEHRHVVDALQRLLAPLCRTLDIPAAPRLHATSRLWHLSTPIRARLRRPAPSSLALACVLHPTPAVCGTPTRRAAALVRAVEPVPRRYFSGLVGWMDQSGDGHWVIALRCGEADPRGLRLYAGAGIVRGSLPDAELAETGTKLATMLGALDDAHGAAPAPPSPADPLPATSPTGAPR